MYLSENSFFIATTGWLFRGDMDFSLHTYIFKISKAYEAFGLLQRNENSMYSVTQNWNYLDTEIDALNISQLQIMFYLLVLGHSISAVVFILEIIVWNWNSRKHHEQQLGVLLQELKIKMKQPRMKKLN